jgi:hypothetical protein
MTYFGLRQSRSGAYRVKGNRVAMALTVLSLAALGVEGFCQQRRVWKHDAHVSLVAGRAIANRVDSSV